MKIDTLTSVAAPRGASDAPHDAGRPLGRWARIFLVLLAALAGAALWLHGPIGQWADYHAFADGRAALGIPNAANVLSNLPFLLVGGWALSRLRVARGVGPATRAWQVFAAAVTCTAFGSAAYHWSPENATLVGDRLPIAWACVALSCAFLAERFDPAWGRPRVLGGALLVATASVAHWWLTERAGAGDLRPYLLVQFLPMLLVPAGLWLWPRPGDPAVVPASAWWGVLGCYAAAKVFELGDRGVYAASGFIISGHTLKHVLAAAGAAWLLSAAVRACTPPDGVSYGNRR
jgi:hypothetical protein